MSAVSNDIDHIFSLQQEHQWQTKISTAEQRVAKLARLKAAIQSHEDEIREALYADLRKSADNAQLEIALCYTDIEHAKANLAEWMRPVDVETSEQFADAKASMVYEARGVVLLFGPWNFPFCLVFQPLIAMIAAGNCALVKPNEMSPRVSKVTARIIQATFEPKEIAVFEGGVELANQLLALPVHHVFFTGSPAVGKVVMAAAAKHLAPVTLELGGKNPVIIDRSADLGDAAAKIAAARNMNSGQVCLCPENVWVAEEQADEFAAAIEASYRQLFYENGALNKDACGKIVDERNFERVTAYLDDAREKGATVVCGGDREPDTLSIHPTLLRDVPPDARLLAEETFGPILTLFTYRELDEAIAAIQQQPKPLALYLYTEDEHSIDYVLQRTSSGGVTINNCIAHCLEHHLPFGGVNSSGMGRYHGVHGFRELSHERAVLLTK